ncbi:MAG: hypothetical protein IPN51_03540 [Chloracidobacterium sp.]|nr:hypothetical protein [Chloracidobacterium sp.]
MRVLAVLVGVDAKGKPTTKVFSWADTRSRNYTEVLRKRFDESETLDRTERGFIQVLARQTTLAAKGMSGRFAKTARWLAFSDYALRLFRRGRYERVDGDQAAVFSIRN